MSRSTLIVAPLAMFAFATTVLAGGAGCSKDAMHNTANVAEHKCNMTKEECLKHMAEARNNGWLGIKYDGDSGKSVVQEVIKGSPAEKAGFKAGDVLYSLNGIEINEQNYDKVSAAWKALKPGSVANYTVKRDGFSKDLTATLGKMPDDVYNAMVAEHMKEDHVDVAKK
jgi:predicted metalloprotease with PDZ domain